MELAVNDVIRLRKKHPCGGDEWLVVKLGVDIKIQCRKCNRFVLLQRTTLERRIRTIVSKAQAGNQSDNP
jgi:hypothetical protein